MFFFLVKKLFALNLVPLLSFEYKQSQHETIYFEIIVRTPWNFFEKRSEQVLKTFAYKNLKN